MPNRLSVETSPYLLQHAENPVDWYPWGAEAIEKARQEDKPIFLSIGYAACHWCHVMAHESFEDPKIAGLMNEHFINIKVDREERPDIDSIYMGAVVAMTGQGGWPMSLFLTPNGKPFYAGTYFPPVPRYGMPSFRQVLEGTIGAWNGDRGQVDDISQKVSDHLQQASRLALKGEIIQKDLLQKVNQTLNREYDWQNGGWGGAPKFPQPMVIEFLLAQATRGDEIALNVAVDILTKMARGGMYDLVGGGFHRYSTDSRWLVPHFEKMLYDNAQLALAYLHAYLITREDRFRQVCEETLDFVRREMIHPDGGFFSSLDADSEGEEGKFYTWSYKQIEELFTDSLDFQVAKIAFGLNPSGNFEGKIVFQKAVSDDEITKIAGIPVDEVRIRLKKIKELLIVRRGERIRPGTDDKVLLSWNALALRAFAEAGRYLARQEYLEVAIRNAEFLLSELFLDGKLMRAWRGGKARQQAFLEDHAALAIGIFSLYQADPNPKWFQIAQELINQIRQNFQDPAGGFFDTHAAQDPLLVRPKDIQDNATPSGNSLAALALILSSEFSGGMELRKQAEEMLGAVQNVLVQYPAAFGNWLNALDLAIGPVQQVAVVGDPADPGYDHLVQALNQTYRPRCIVAFSRVTPEANAPLILQNRPLRNGHATAYVCQEFVCLLPVNSSDEMISQLK